MKTPLRFTPALALMLAFAFAPAFGQAQHTLTGEFRKHVDFPSRVLTTKHTVVVSLPPGYDATPDRRYPVLYLQDGQNLFDGATSFIPGQEWRVDETAQRLMTQGAIEPLIVVGIYNAGERRLAEYTPTPDPKYGGGDADLYARFLVEELKPFVDSTYRSLPGPESTGVGGSSLGGLLAMHLGLRYPNVFGRLAVVSPSVWWDGREIVGEVDRIAARTPARIWLDTGTAEGKGVKKDARRLRDALVRKGWTLNTDLSYFEANGAAHNEAAWSARVEPILRFLFPAH